ncbi:MAG TPA: hypothetical protein VF069_24105 [Streptosporangiaceae bacterium]
MQSSLDTVVNLVSYGSAVVSLVVAAVGTWLTSRRHGRDGKTAEVTLEDRLKELGDSARQSARLLAEVEAEIDARAARAARLKRDAEDAEHILALTEQERHAVARLVRAEVGAEGRRNFRQGLWINLLFFVAGVLASIAVTLLIHPLS